MENTPKTPRGQRIGLFVTCLVDTMRPSVGFAAVKLLEQAGYKVEVPPTQTCCGQPNYNSGDNASTVTVARSVIETFSGFDYVVSPSGSCAGMIKDHYVTLFDNDPEMKAKADNLAIRTFELTSFLIDVARFSGDFSVSASKITYHDSCSGLRELDVKQQPRELLSKHKEITLIEGVEAEACCGFGGTFCTKYPEISEQMVDRKVDDIISTGADMVLGGDLGCLMNIAGRLKRRNSNVKVRHVAELLAGQLDHPAIGEGSE